MNYTIYHPNTGEIQSVIQTVNEDLAELNLLGHTYIPGNYDGNAYYIANGIAIDKPQQPQDGLAYTFDWNAKTWIMDIATSATNIKMQRNQLLTAVDRVNPVWYASLTETQQQALVAYRQQLLDVPQQASFPSQVDWPAKPTWL
jgi:hypothetical protein